MQDIDPAALVAALGDAVMVCDATGAITYWNAACERMFGYTAAEAMGRSMDIIIPERLRGRHWEGYHQTMASGVTKYGSDVLRVPAVDKQGKKMSIAFTVALLYAPDGKVNAIASVIREETNRFNEDQALRKRVAELEAKLSNK
ncbi:PAS domain-containing protein [Rhodoferax sp. GW822-FHT02A01]|uniref:PAS domain-containing protein n=1 Tax=Rhodoferax sp. GW822-FHT02A01 TaxID=3141537 RepID=UPI00315D96CF